MCPMEETARRAIWLRDDDFLAHHVPGHPERPERIRALEAEMSAAGWFGASRVQAVEIERSVLLPVHPEEHIAFLEALCGDGGGAIDADTYAVPGTYAAALRAVGGAAALVDALLGGEADVGVSALRPPGHHAEAARAMGFCFFGNAAVAARRATVAHGLSRVMIVDWDVHHGNGTNDIFHADDDVLFVSIHEWPLYPGTGPASDVGSADGEGYTVNLPVPGGSGDASYRSLVEHVACGLIRTWEPELVLISAGFDAHGADPLAECLLDTSSYAAMASRVRDAAAGWGAPVGAVLEGGYHPAALAESVVATMDALGGGS